MPTLSWPASLLLHEHPCLEHWSLTASVGTCAPHSRVMVTYAYSLDLGYVAVPWVTTTRTQSNCHSESAGTLDHRGTWALPTTVLQNLAPQWHIRHQCHHHHECIHEPDLVPREPFHHKFSCGKKIDQEGPAAFATKDPQALISVANTCSHCLLRIHVVFINVELTWRAEWRLCCRTTPGARSAKPHSDSLAHTHKWRSFPTKISM